MSRPSRQNPEIREYILRHVAEDPDTIGPLTAKTFGLSRTAVAGYFHRLIEEGLLTAEGKTRARRHALKPLVDLSFTIEAARGLAEDVVWRFRILPSIKNVRQNVIDVCQYGFTEMLNNVFDHSGSPDAVIGYKQDYARIEMTILDHGIGVFEKIRTAFNLIDRRSALLELSKGKLTSDPKHHTGEGIFFTSRMFERFSILADDLFYVRTRHDNEDWLIEANDHDYVKGTSIQMSIATDATWTRAEVFNHYQGDDLRFRKTHVPVRLGRYPGEQLVSRSQAKRILARFDGFSEVMLDFQGVTEIGQAFADEIFRVFRIDHPNIRLHWINTTPEVERYIVAASAT